MCVAGAGANGTPQQPPAEDVAGQNPLFMLMRSLLPWVNAGEQPEYGADEEEDEGGQEG
jgi:hypothetical protein